MAEESRSPWISPLPLIALVLIAAGVWVRIPPLETTRPAGDRVVAAQPAVQDVEARLWQDPFVVRNIALPDRDLRKSRNPAKDDPQHAPERLAQRVREALKDGPADLHIVGAMVSGATYAEDAETRRRSRFAVIAALQQLGFRPDNADALGYAWLPDGSSEEAKRGVWPPDALRDDAMRGVGLPEIVPFEWLTRAAAGDAKDDRRPTKLLLLWIDENALGDKPVRSLDLALRILLCRDGPKPAPTSAECERTLRSLLCQDAAKQQHPPALCEVATSTPDTRRMTIRLVGPAGSNVLKSIYDETHPADAKDLPVSGFDFAFFTSAATIAPESLSTTLPDELRARAKPRDDAAQKGGEDADQSKGEQAYLFSWPSAREGGKSKQTGGKVFRVAAGDERLAGALAYELVELRGIGEPWRDWNPLPGRGGTTKDRCAGVVVLISEADTQYGQALSRQVEKSIADKCGVPPGSAPVRHFRYFRGLDGLPGQSGKSSGDSATRSAQGKAGASDIELPAAPPERAEGRSQFDYLRRLGAQLAALNEAEWREKRPGIRAVGVLGSDLYDKLLILQALREGLPHAVFFTTDLDARLLHPDHARWARNVVTASGYGLALRPQLQGTAAPFRDSYQTGTYFATLAALNPSLRGALDRDWFDGAQVFEIGRTRPVEVTRGDAGLRERRGRGQGPTVAGEQPEVPCSLAHPASCRAVYVDPTDRGRAPFGQALAEHWGLALAALAAGLAFVVLTMRTVLTHRTALPFGIGLLVLLLVLRWVALADEVSGQGEPLEWLEGVSLWPVVALRLLAAFLAVASMVYGWLSMQHRLRELARRFFVGDASGGTAEPSAEPVQWHDLVRHLFPARRYTCREADLRPFMTLDRSVNATHLWQQFMRDNRFAPAATRVFVSLALFLGVALLMFLFAPPNLPYRGETVRLWSVWTTLASLVLLWALIFALVDSTRRAALLIRCIADHRIAWPASVVADFERETGLDRAYLGRWIGFSASVGIARSVENLVYLPFFVLLLLVVTFSNLFDSLNFPAPMVVVFVGAVVYLIFCARTLRLAAEAVRSAALASYRGTVTRLKGGRLEAEAGAAAAEGDAGRIRAQVEDLMERIKSERNGAFGPILQQPYLKALLLPLSGYGGMQVLDYFLVGGL